MDTQQGWLGMQWIDWISIIGFFVISLSVGLIVARRAGKSTTDFFLGGRNMPWWLLGVSMVATTFSTDTPNLVTGLVREGGVAANWVWWVFLLTGMLTVFIYARLWRISGVMTDIEFYELRYSGKPAAFLRGFRALYLGVFFNIMIMAAVSIAAIKIGEVMFGLGAWETLAVAGTITLAYSMLGGLTGVLITDFIQFGIALAGAFMAASYALDHEAVGGLTGLLSHEAVREKMALLPDFSDASNWVPLLLVPLAVQWWSTWYPGSEPGGGGYIAQRMLSARDESHAMGATLFFNCAHYALRPWPWIIVALCSLLVFPDLDSIGAAFPEMNREFLAHDIAYPAMLKTVLPPGLLGLVVASLIAAYMSTISTHLNWGASYVINDWYRRFINPEAEEKQLVRLGRMVTAAMMLCACILATMLKDAVSAFGILLQIGAGTGLLFILRWFWWRINAWSEISAMIVSFIVAVFFWLATKFEILDWPSWVQLVVGVAITTTTWMLVSLKSRPTDQDVLADFCRKIKPGGPGWAIVREKAGLEAESDWRVPTGLACMGLSCMGVYGALFATGSFIYGHTMRGVALSLIALLATIAVTRLWKKLV